MICKKYITMEPQDIASNHKLEGLKKQEIEDEIIGLLESKGLVPKHTVMIWADVDIKIMKVINRP
jgi:hypothetical protein